MKNAFWIIPAAILIWIGIKKYNLSKSYTLNFKRINLSDISFSNPVVNIVYEIINPTQTTANVQNVTGSLFYNGIYVGNIVDFKQFTIKEGSTEFKISAKIDYVGLSKLVLNMNNKYQLYFDGKITIDYVNFPLQFIYEK